MLLLKIPFYDLFITSRTSFTIDKRKDFPCNVRCQIHWIDQVLIESVVLDICKTFLKCLSSVSIEQVDGRVVGWSGVV